MEPYKSSAGQTLTGLSINHPGSLQVEVPTWSLALKHSGLSGLALKGSGLGAPALKGPGLDALALKVSN